MRYRPGLGQTFENFAEATSRRNVATMSAVRATESGVLSLRVAFA
jgi:hypothetical protein